MEQSFNFEDFEDDVEILKRIRQAVRDTCFISEGDYLRHIEEQIDMYHLLQDFAANIRLTAQEMDCPAFSRLATQYERKADKLFLSWNIPDDYMRSGDPDDLDALMEEELYPVFDTCEEEDDEDEDAEDVFRFLFRDSEMSKESLFLSLQHTLGADISPCPLDQQ